MKYFLTLASLYFYVSMGGFSSVASVLANDLTWLFGLYYMGVENLLIVPAHAG